MNRINAAEEIMRPARERGLDDLPALIADGRTITHRELGAMAQRAGIAMRAMDIAHEHRVLMMLNDSAELVSAYLGAMMIGAVAIAFNTRSAPPDLEFAIEDSRARLLIIDREYVPIYRAISGRLKNPPQVAIVGDADSEFANFVELTSRASGELAAEPMSPDDMAFWIYTSGTTGTPKAAVHLHKDVLNAGDYLGGVLGVRRGDRLFASSKLFFAYALGNCLFGAFRLGATTILLDDWPQAVTIAQVIERQRPSVVFAVPTIYRNLLAAGVATQEGFRAVRHYVSAGERLPESLWERWRAATGVEIIDGMGTSETIYMLLTNYPGAV